MRLFFLLDISSLFVYTSTMSDKIITRNAYVIYVRGMGYMKNRAAEFHKEFDQARLFPREKAALDSVQMNIRQKKIPKDAKWFVIPVEMTLDPRKLFKTILSSE